MNLQPSKRVPLLAEYLAIFIALPAILSFFATRGNVHMVLWAVTLWTILLLNRDASLSWHTEWHGAGLTRKQFILMAVRFAVATALVIAFTRVIAPNRLFSFPLQRPMFWLIVMIFYPLLSALPQEVVFRSFFFWRYAPLFPANWMMLAVSAFSFGFMHAVFHNWISPTLSAIAGLFLAQSYLQHRSLKYAMLEHAAYGCMVFTVGIGFYFLVGGLRL